MSSEESVNTIVSNDHLGRLSWTILLNDSLKWSSCHAIGMLMVLKTIFQISSLYLLAKKSWFALIYYSVKTVSVTEKSMTAWEHSFMKTISNYFCVISSYEFCICCRSCWKVDRFFTIERERSIDAWIVANFFQPNTTDNFSYPRNCRVFFWINVYCFITIPSFSFNIIMINPKLFSFLSLCFCSANL